MIGEVLNAYVIFGRSANHCKMLSLNLFSSENPLLYPIYFRWRCTGSRAGLFLHKHSISLHHIRNWGIFRTELIILNVEDCKGSLGGSLCCFFLISETRHFNSSSEHNAILCPGSLLTIPSGISGSPRQKLK